MSTARAVTMIPPRINRFSTTPIGCTTKKRVCAYARVSTDNDEQLSSYDAQVDYYTRYINEKEEWEFVSIYTDEGISATSTKNREGFKTMISDALDGKINLILTKSVSRFARNTVDTLTTVRQLKEKGVEVYFEKENIYTLDSKGELLITIMSSLAQEESRSISENVTWGQRKRFADGKVNLPYAQFLGYEKGEDGFPKIVEREAKVIRLIYKMFLDGKTPSSIATYLTSENIMTPAGKTNWRYSTVVSILSNEKYKGDAILQKSFTVDFLTKKKKTNEGEIPQYYVENSHPAIVSPEVYDLAQYEFKKRKATGRYTSSTSCLSNKIICGECGSAFGSKVWHSTSKYRRIIWQCNHKFKGDKVCQTPHLYEATIKDAFLHAYNKLIEDKDSIICTYDDIISVLTDTTKLDKEAVTLQSECDIIFGLLKDCVEENAHTAIDQSDYQQRYETLVARYEASKIKLSQLNDKKQERTTKRENILKFLQRLKTAENLLTQFDEDLWNATIDELVVYSEHNLLFKFRDGTELPLEI